MNRETFMSRLKARLAGFSSVETARVLEYYDELFSDSLEAGKTEEEIIAGLETPEAIAERVRVELAFMRAEQEPSAKGLNTVILVLLGIFALPVGLPLALAVMMVVLAVGMVGISLAISALAILLSLALAGVGLIVVGVAAVVSRAPLAGFALMGSGLVCGGMGLLAGVGTWALSRVLIRECVKLFRKLYMSATRKKKEAGA